MALRSIKGAVLGFAGLVALAPAVGRAGDSPVRELAPEVTVRIDRGHATVTLRRTFENPGATEAEAVVNVKLADTAFTDLRVQNDDGTWSAAALRDGDAAYEMYRETSGPTMSRARASSILSWRALGEAELRVFPVPVHGTRVVELTAHMRLAYAHGELSGSLPAIAPQEKSWLRVLPADASDEIRVNDVRVAPGARVEVGAASFTIAPRRTFPLEGHVARITLSEGRELFHASLDAPPKLSKVPENAAVVVALDVSRSMSTSPEQLGMLARGYLAHFPKATVTVLAFHRKVEAPFGENKAVGDVLEKLATWAPAQQNGSALDDAIQRADAILATTTARERRLLVVTDLRTRAGLTPDRLAKTPLRSGALMHIAEPGTPSVVRNDTSEWAAAPRRTGGLLYRVPSVDEVSAAQIQLEQLARPVRIDHVTIEGAPEGFSLETIEEGMRAEHLAVLDASSPTKLVLRGELWSRPVTIPFGSSRANDQRAAATVLASTQGLGIFDEDARIVSRRGHVLSSAMSFVVAEPGRRPPQPDRTGVGGGGTWSSVSRCGCCGGTRAVATVLSADSRVATLKRAVERAWDACGGHGVVTAQTETHDAEIADVRVTTEPPDGSAATCVTESLWSLELSPLVFNVAQEARTVTASR